jgi:predicted secreted protein
MSLTLSCAITKPFLKFNSSSLKYQQQRPNISLALVRCESISKDSSDENELQEKLSKLDKGSPIIIIEAPKMIKTAASVPCLRVNSGLVKPGDVGRYFIIIV